MEKMDYKILKKKSSYKSEIQRLGNFLVSDKLFFNIFIKIINFSKSNIIDNIEKKYLNAKVIEENEFKKFRRLLEDFSKIIESDKTVKQGDLLEYIMTQIKRPLCLNFENFDYESESKIYDCKTSRRINSNNCDLDFVLYDLDKVKIDEYFVYFNDYVEFIECKNDINTFLYLNDKDKVGKSTLDKLNMFTEIKNLFNNSTIKCIFVSFIKPAAIHKSYLKSKGYGFIQIVDGDELMNVLF